jgi:hypothetical protein
MKRTSNLYLAFAGCLALILILGGCTPQAAPTEAVPPAPVGEPTQTTAPLPPLSVEETAPPTPEPAIEPDCTQPGDHTYQDPLGSTCFSFPASFTLNPVTEDFFIVEGPALDESSPEPLRVVFSMTVQTVSPNANLSRLVDAYLSQSYLQEMSPAIGRAPGELDGVPAEVLEDVPGRLSSRLVMVIHDDMLYTLTFFPADVPEAAEGLEELYSTVTSSFRFLDNATPAANVSPIGSATWLEFGQGIRFQYDASLALWVDALTTPATPATPDDLYPESSPAAAQFRFLGYGGGIEYQLPYPLAEARLMVYQTADFTGYGDNLPRGYMYQKDGLSILLYGDVDPAFCATPHTSEAQALPFLPYLNSAQVFCAKPEVIEFEGGSGIRYLTAYSQDLGPVLDWTVFYTFQGLTDDGQFYISAAFPVQTGVFPLEAPANSTPEELAQQLTALEAKADDDFYPSLALLDELIKTLIIRE